MKRALVLLALSACGSSASHAPTDATPELVADAAPPDARAICPPGGGAAVGHVVVIVQENHTFDTYFGRWCTAATGSNPTCTSGPSCCEAGPSQDPTGASPAVLDDTATAAYDPNHDQDCELGEIDDGKMDGFVTGTSCSNPENFGYAQPSIVKPYRDLAAAGALADRYFQPIAGASSSNDMYLAVAKEVFLDDDYEPDAAGSQCAFEGTISYAASTIADLLLASGKTVTWYNEGWADMLAANGKCPMPPLDCEADIRTYPCVLDPNDIPFLYYRQFEPAGSLIQDYAKLQQDLAGGTLPDVSFVKGLGYHTEHPGLGTTLSAGVTFATGVIQAVESSCYKDSTLILLTWDEGGGYFDHVAPPAESTVDEQPYGTRVPLLAIGPYALAGVVSHVPMEHSSITRFLEWNYLGQLTGQLGGRDAAVNNVGSLLDPTKTAMTVPAGM